VNTLLQAIGFGIVTASVIAIAAVGFTMQFGIANMINLAYGEVMIVCAYVAFYVNQAGVSVWASMIAAALAMVATNSADRTVYNPKIIDIANGVPGATVVSTFKEGVDALKAGKSIRYVGAAGENNFNQYNNSQQGYNLVTMDKDGNEVVLGSLSEAQTQSIIDAGGGA